MTISSISSILHFPIQFMRLYNVIFVYLIFWLLWWDFIHSAIHSKHILIGISLIFWLSRYFFLLQCSLSFRLGLFCRWLDCLVLDVYVEWEESLINGTLLVFIPTYFFLWYHAEYFLATCTRNVLERGRKTLKPVWPGRLGYLLRDSVLSMTMKLNLSYLNKFVT